MIVPVQLRLASDSVPAAAITVDWGTSSCRAWVLGSDGSVLADARSRTGTLAVVKQTPVADTSARADAFEATLWQLAGSVLERYPQVPVIACGMVGSTLGWKETAYLPTPTDIHVSRSDLTEVPIRGGRSAWIVPGIRQAGDPYPDVIRGEETQLIGVLEQLDRAGVRRGRDCTILLPGTHTKWVRIVDDRVGGFTTAMSGELFGILMGHSILGKPATRAHAFDRAAFERGLEVADAAGGLGLAAELFSTRTLNMDGDVPSAGIGDYLSGLLIGDEVGHLLPLYTADGDAATTVPVAVCGNARLTAQYRLALAARGVTVVTIDEAASVSGLWRIARDTGLVDLEGVSAVDAADTRRGDLDA